MEDAVRFALWLNVQRYDDSRYLNQEDMEYMYQKYLLEIERFGEDLLDKRYR